MAPSSSVGTSEGVCPLPQQPPVAALRVRFDFPLYMCQISRFAAKRSQQCPRLLVRDWRGSAPGAGARGSETFLWRRKRGRAEPFGVFLNEINKRKVWQ